jgi:hypothetical protein
MAKQNGLIWRFAGLLAALSLALLAAGQGMRLKHGTFIAPDDLPGEFGVSLKKMGGRLTKAENAAVNITGALTDASGTRQVALTIQAPGYLRFQDQKSSQVITYDGAAWRKSRNAENDSRIQESLLAHFPDAVLLQMASGGGFRRIGGRFRGDNGRTPGYTGPFMTLYEYAPAARPGLAPGQPLQQGYMVFLDEATFFMSQIRVAGAPGHTVATRFNKWVEQNGQWYPGEVVRLEDGAEVLKLTVGTATNEAQRPPSAFALPGSED